MSKFCSQHRYPVMLIDGWCDACTHRREINSQRYQHDCHCPRCGRKEQHRWARVSYLDTAQQPVHQTRVVRKCAVCNYEWRQW